MTELLGQQDQRFTSFDIALFSITSSALITSSIFVRLRLDHSPTRGLLLYHVCQRFAIHPEHFPHSFSRRAQSTHIKSPIQAIQPSATNHGTMGLFGSMRLPELDDDDVRVIRDRRGRLAVSRPSGRPRVPVSSLERGSPPTQG